MSPICGKSDAGPSGIPAFEIVYTQCDCVCAPAERGDAEQRNRVTFTVGDA